MWNINLNKLLLLLVLFLISGCTYVTINNSIVTCEDINVDKTQDIKPSIEASGNDVSALP